MGFIDIVILKFTERFERIERDLVSIRSMLLEIREDQLKILEKGGADMKPNDST